MEKHEFNPKEWVLVRDEEEEKWKLDIFSHKIDDMYQCVGDWWSQCIPYEGNESLLSKNDKPEERHVWHAGDRVDVLSDFDDMWHSGFIVEIDYTRSDAEFSYRVESEGFKSITPTGKVWCRADQLREPEEKPEEEEFKFGERVEIRKGDEWCEAVVIEIDHSGIPYQVATADGDTHWCCKGDIRRA